ncbi:hypothetical protein ABT381_35840, partial [Streptomyces sp. NPDC000151]
PGAGSPRRRFAFAAAGAVSLAAFALSGALPLEAAVDTAAGRGGGANSPLTASPAAEASSAVGRERPGAGRGSRDRDALLGALQGRSTPAAASAEFYPAAASLPVTYGSPLAGDGSARLSPLIAPGSSGPSGSGAAVSGLGTDGGTGAVAGTSAGASHGLPGAGTGAGGGTDGSAGPSGRGPLPSALASPASTGTPYPAAPLPPLEPKRPLLTRSASAAP